MAEPILPTENEALTEVFTHVVHAYAQSEAVLEARVISYLDNNNKIVDYPTSKISVYGKSTDRFDNITFKITGMKPVKNSVASIYGVLNIQNTTIPAKLDWYLPLMVWSTRLTSSNPTPQFIHVVSGSVVDYNRTLIDSDVIPLFYQYDRKDAPKGKDGRKYLQH
jgi:hypothetical protein